VDPFVQCSALIVNDPQYAELARKLPLTTGISFQMLADESLASEKERPLIASWYERNEACWRDSEGFRQARLPPEVVAMMDEGNATLQDIGVDLYNRKITFGEANKRIQELSIGLSAKGAQIRKQYQAEMAAQQEVAREREARAQAYADARAAQQDAQRQQRMALILNYMRANQPKLLPPPSPPPTYNTNCYTVGNATNCTTR
jgi:hypothetical protein